MIHGAWWAWKLLDEVAGGRGSLMPGGVKFTVAWAAGVAVPGLALRQGRREPGVK